MSASLTNLESTGDPRAQIMQSGAEDERARSFGTLPRLKILFLSQRVPYPPNRGDKITTWRLVERMKRNHDVHIVAFAHDEADVESANKLREMGFPTTVIPYRDRWAKLTSLPLLATSTALTLGVYGSKALQAVVDREIVDCDMAYAYSSSMGAFLEKHASTPRVMHFGELDSDKWRQYGERTRFPMSWVYRREQRTLLAFEQRIARSFTDNVLCTPLEQAVFEREITGARSTVLRNGVDLDYFSPRPAAREAAHIVFTGVMNYFPNSDGCVWFVNEILPLVRREHPTARFTIIGSQPTPEVTQLTKIDGVAVTGFVTDTRDFIARGAVSVAPLRIARGIQNKVLEAMAMGLPVVGTTCATQGVDGMAGRDYIVSDDATGFARAVSSLLADPDVSAALGSRARSFVEANYDWDVVFEPLDQIIERCRSLRAR
ncbi:MAG: TIGR03087 family PEP-CTERM/XrtA system glycosyltransferase [Planctomycetota bacterium]|nr:TIGR03087 family PEP-CTERM/XrtA system glycosyltransferase [Planctomycetota bacterium]